MSQALVQIDSAASATLSATAVIPVLNGAVTGTGNANAAQTTLASLKTYFEGGTVDEFLSTVAVATPAALTATQFTGFASTVSGATLMGYGTTGDVTLKNRAGTDVLVVTANTLNVTLAGALAITGALSGVTSAVFSTSVSSITAFATPSALTVTTGQFFASTVSGATLMGYGSTADVTLKNRAGTDVIKVTSNTTGVVLAGALAITGALSGATTGAFSGVVTTAGVTSSAPTGAGIGYTTGAGGAVSQLTDRSTGVTLNTLTGTITGQATSLAAGAGASFVVTNSTVAIGDTIILSVQSGPTANTSVFSVSTVAAGSFTIKAFNVGLVTADTGAPIINFAVLKAVSS